MFFWQIPTCLHDLRRYIAPASDIYKMRIQIMFSGRRGYDIKESAPILPTLEYYAHTCLERPP